MFEWLRSAEPGAPEGDVLTPRVHKSPAQDSITATGLKQRPLSVQEEHIEQTSDVQRLGQLLCEGRYVEASTLVLQVRPPSEAWDALEPKQQRAVSPANSIHVDASGDGSKAAASLQQGPPALLQQQAITWQGYCSKLQVWSARSLQQACPDSSMSALQRQQLKQAAANHGTQKTPQNWWQLYPPISSTQGCQLAAAVYHLSSSRDQAWTSISQALWHGLALDLRATDTRSLRRTTTNKSALKKDPAAQPGSISSSSSSFSLINSSSQQQHHWSPHGAVKRLAELQAKQSSRVKEVLGQFPCSATLGVELAEAGQALLPTTYLQLVGQKLLGQAVAAMPVLLSLAEAPPDWLLRGLFTQPFADALRLALSDILNNPDGDASPYIPHLEQQPHSRDFRRIYPSEASNAVPTGVAGVSGLLDVGGLMWRAGNQALLGVLACIFRDVQEFEAGLLLLVPDGPDSTGAYRRTSSISSYTATVANEAGKKCKNALCKPQLAQLLAKDLRDAVVGCRKQLGELLAQSTKQMMLMTLQEELQQPLHELLLSAAAVTADAWPAMSAPAAAAAPEAGRASDHNTSSVSGPPGAISEAAAQQSHINCNCSIFGSGSLWVVDPYGAWELLTTGSRGTGIAKMRHTGSFQHFGAAGSRAIAGLRAPERLSDHNSPTSFSKKPFAGQGPPVVGPGRRTSSVAGASAGAGAQQQQQCREEYVRQPQQVTQAQAQLLVFVGAFMARRQHYPLLIQDTLVTALIGALSAAMQHIDDLLSTNSSSSTSSSQAPFSEEQTGYICCCISMVLCIHRRLLWLKETWVPQQSEQGLLVMEQSIQQAVLVAANLQQSLIEQLVSTVHWAVMPSLQEQLWTSHRQPLSSKQSTTGRTSSRQQQQDAASGIGAYSAVASPGVRVWHMLMQAWQYTLRRVLPATMTVEIIGQVLQHSCRALSQLYMPLQPSPVWRPIYLQDIAVIATTAWEFSQPLQVTLPLMLQLGGQYRTSVTGGLYGMRRSIQGQLQALGATGSSSAVGGTLMQGRVTGDDCLQLQEQHTEAVCLPVQLVAEVSGLCKQLVMRAAELSGRAAADGSSTATSEAGDKILQQQQQQPQGLVSSSGQGGLQLDPHPACLAKAISPSNMGSRSCSSSSAGSAAAQQQGAWGWLTLGLQLILDSRVLGQGLPARRMLDVMSHAAIGSELDDVESDAWVQQGLALLAERMQGIS